MLKAFLISVGLPLGGMGLILIWKELLKGKLSVEDRLAVFELLVAALTLTIAISLNDTDARSHEAREVAKATTIIVGIGVLPVVGVLVRRAYDQGQSHPFTDEEVWWANGLGVWVFFLSYFFTHLPS